MRWLMMSYTQPNITSSIQLFWERLSEKVHATILKGIVGDFKCTVFQRNFKESYGRPLIYVCECWRKITKVGSTATVVRNRVLIISHITFRDCRVHFIFDKLSRNSCINRAIFANLQRRPLKLGRLIVLQKTHLTAIKHCVPMATYSFPVHIHLISICDFQLEKG